MKPAKHGRKGIPKGAVLADAKKALDEYRGTNAYLREAAGFDHNLQLLPGKQAIATQLFNDLMKDQYGYKREQKELDFVVLCANLLYYKRRRPIAISLNRNHWTASRYRRASYFTVKKGGAMDLLSSNGLINLREGYGHADHSKAQRTKIWPTVKLLEAFEPIRMEDCVFDPVELVNLRDKAGKHKAGKPIDYKDTRETRRVREILRKVNMVTDQALVQYIDPESRMGYRLKTRLHCVYNLDFKHGGRLYTAERDRYQQLSEEDRACIQIDSEPTIELDFSGLHPRLLYAWEGIQYDDDPYIAVIDSSQLRPIIKDLVLVMINSGNEVKAVRAGNKFLFDNRNYYMRLRRRGLTVKDDLIPMIKEAHKPISKYFCTDAGLRAMNTDSKIALDIIAHFANDDIPILAIHDSFIVQRQYKFRLRKAMILAYKKQTGGFRCPIK